ncbi:MAG: amidohydrolase [Gammaproteobacteria bacterium]|nr:amidohydrolase [Gammaproteobacteria bacterium]|tara:strand:+ start:869 stop:2536 length:1668 start_codon:yes stop_codon:yes gene_type:complete
MNSADLIIRNARIIDGTGAAEQRGDVAITDGKISAVGTVEGSAIQELDAQGRILTPGFIDIHTHFDPQLCWDRLATPSIEHGVTTVVIGNCSLSLAPVRGLGSEKIVSMFGVIEDIYKPTFDAAVPFSWESFSDYLDFIRPGLGINVAALIGHSALRYYVMGAESQERTASADEIQQMCQIVEEAMAAGAAGISSSYVDRDEKMRPVPSQYADLDEKIALAKAVATSGRGVWQVVPNFLDMEQQLANIRELGDISLAASIPCSLQPVLSSPLDPRASQIIAALEAERERGARVYGQVMPRCFDMNLRLSETSMLLFALPSWKAIMDLPSSERRGHFEDPDTRAKLVDEMGNATGMSMALPMLKVGEVSAEENQPYKGRSLAEICQTEDKALADVILDLSLADDLDAEFKLENVMNADKEAVADLIDHPLLHFGASDAGAHITQFCGTGDTTHMLEHFVRDSGRITLERGVHRMTGEVAADWGLHDRGTIAEGKAADLVLLDLDAIHCGDMEFVDDFPGEARRYVRRADGYAAVLVNGEIVLQDGEYTDARAGKVV